jgi:hypothetical protein
MKFRGKSRFSQQHEEVYHRLTNVFGDWRLSETYFRRFHDEKTVPDPTPETVGRLLLKSHPLKMVLDRLLYHFDLPHDFDVDLTRSCIGL